MVVAHMGICSRHKLVERIEDTEFVRLARAGKVGNWRCSQCNRLLQWEPITGTKTGAKCGPACTDAIRSKCRCSCGGIHHATTFGVFERAS